MFNIITQWTMAPHRFPRAKNSYMYCIYKGLQAQDIPLLELTFFCSWGLGCKDF
jgi:hypothetical protein